MQFNFMRGENINHQKKGGGIMKCRECPRCGGGSLECFSTHSYCFNCNYSSVDQARLNARPERKKSQTEPLDKMLEASFTPY